MREIDEKVLLAANDKIALDDFIQEYELFIMQTAAKAAGKYITKNDDEWSIALSAFSEAVLGYSFNKGSFLPFAKLVIKRRCIDYKRMKMRSYEEISVNPIVFNGETSEVESDSEIIKQVTKKSSQSADDELKYEIAAAAQKLSEYSFSFSDLVDCSPKSKKTKESCAIAVAFILKNPIVAEQLRKSKLLPIKIIENNTRLPRKILENHRKYIIAAVEILSGDYPHLAEYLRFIREEI